MMKIWVVYFRGEPEFASQFFQDAKSRANQLRDASCEEDVMIVEEEI